jgi:hypothetical protein
LIFNFDRIFLVLDGLLDGVGEELDDVGAVGGRDVVERKIVLRRELEILFSRVWIF